MCISNPRRAAPPPAPPAAPTTAGTDAAVDAAKDQERKRARAVAGRQSTILTSARGLETQANVSRPTLLGRGGTV
jgi:hypothetical protein